MLSKVFQKNKKSFKKVLTNKKRCAIITYVADTDGNGKQEKGSCVPFAGVVQW